jgi:hypothetical protein
MLTKHLCVEQSLKETINSCPVRDGVSADSYSLHRSLNTHLEKATAFRLSRLRVAATSFRRTILVCLSDSFAVVDHTTSAANRRDL